MTPIENVIDKLSGVSRSGTSGHQWTASCPAHEDAHASLAVGVNAAGAVLLKCYAGCDLSAIVRSLGLELRDLFPQNVKVEPAPPVTVGLLAWDKRLPADFLKSLGLVTNGDCVSIPYFDADGKLLFTRERSALSAKKGSHQPKGVPLAAYGQQFLAKFRAGGRLVLVEGESDSWTGWFHDLPFLGLPGASAIKTLTADVLAGFGELFVWQEPGDAGESFVNGIACRLKEFAWPGSAKVISLLAVKDPNALHQRDPAGFRAAFDAALANAKPMPEPKKEKKEKSKRPPLIVPDIIPTLAEKWKERPVPNANFFPNTDLGNAERLVFRHGEDIRYCDDLAHWLVWDKTRWKIDKKGAIKRRAEDTVRAIHAEARTPGLEADRKFAIERWSLDSESHARLRAMTSLAQNAVQGDLMIPVLPDELDVNPWLFNCLTGTINLQTGDLQPHCRTDYITKIADVEFDAAAKCPEWLKFLNKVMGGSAGLIDFLRLAVGYSMTASVSEKCFFFLHGKGDNGKSTAITVMEQIFGDYWAKTTADTILDRGFGGGIPNDVARLMGARFVSTAELPEGRRLDEAKIKDLTGCDTISARFLRHEFFDFRPCFKLWMYGNHKPTIRGADEGIWRRVRLIPFTVSIPKAEQDGALPAKLTAELPGILNWAVSGCLDWQRIGLPFPDEVRDATAGYRSEMDVLGEWIEECCITATNAVCSSSELYGSYKDWCDRAGEYTISQRRLSAALKDRGFDPYKTNSTRGWKGINLLPRTESTNGKDLSDFDR